MFTIHNIYVQKANTTIDVAFNNKSLSFVISSLISKRNKADLDETLQLKLINSYMDYKGEQFKEELFNILEAIDEAIVNSSFKQEIYPLPYNEITRPILDFLDKDDIYKFLKDVYGLIPPRNLPDVFDPGIEQDGRGSRVQTYLKTDYLELASLALIMKVLLLPLGSYARLHADALGIAHKEGNSYRDYILFHLIRPHAIYNTDAMQKLLGLIEKLIERSKTDEGSDAVRVLEKQIPSEEIPNYILASVIIQKLSIATLIDDDADKNIITKIYNYVNNDLKTVNGADKTIRDKNPIPDTDSGSGDSESMIESYKISQDISNASRVEMDWAISTIDKIIYQLPPSQKQYVDVNMVKDAQEFMQKMYTATIKRSQIAILGYIFKTIIDPRSLDYITIDSLLNLFTVAFSYLWNSGNRHLAVLLCSVAEEVKSDEMHINIRSNISRLRQDTKEELDYYFPYKRTVNSETDKNLAEEAIDIIAEEYYANNWIYLPTAKYLKQVIEEVGGTDLVTNDLKLVIADFIIKNERMINVDTIRNNSN